MFVAEAGRMTSERQLLSTGEVARHLGVSRQQVVNMCGRDEIEHVFVGRHRRIPAREVRRILGSGRELTREQERSLWLHRARGNIERWRAEHRSDGMTVRYLDAWERVLDEGLEAVLDTLTSTSPEACELRQNSPFAGILDDETRVQVLRSFKKHWERGRGAGRPADDRS
ncbi:transcriptional regulator [Nocardioides daphniae]|uniref:Transcriptional regulator n=1 Tax=Nocardioides daphniae TaxID=402297 RepID=A0ABQ1QJX0_9ACTN|nr:transcriptional regulator [Nocardioides daphniae]